MKTHHEVVIVGAGLSGLTCAVKCQESGIDYILIDKQSRFGGRIGSIVRDGFVFDLGFQVYNTSYTLTNKLLGNAFTAFNWFKPGAVVHINGQPKVFSDPLRDPGTLLHTLRFPKASWADKLKLQKLRNELAGFGFQNIPEDDSTTRQFLQEYGFSDSFIDYFFIPFFSGVFLENELATASHFFKFVFSSLNLGYASLPPSGMQEIPDTLAKRLEPQRVLLGSSIVTLLPNKRILLGDGHTLTYDHLILTGESVQLTCNIDLEYLPACTLYFATSQEAPLQKYIHLFPEDALINHVAFVSAISPGYSPSGQNLVSVTVLGDAINTPDLEYQIPKRLSSIYGGCPDLFRLVHGFRFRKGTLYQKPGFFSDAKPRHSDVILGGEYFTNGSIEGAVQSGLHAFNSLPPRIRERQN